MFTRKITTALFIMIITAYGINAYAASPKETHLQTYQRAACSDNIVRYCVKAKASNNLWWIAFDPAKPLPIGAEDPGLVICDQAIVGTNLKGAFTPTPTIKCVIKEAYLIE